METKPFRATLPEDLIRRVKAAASMEDQTASEFTADALEAWLADRAAAERAHQAAEASDALGGRP